LDDVVQRLARVDIMALDMAGVVMKNGAIETFRGRFEAANQLLRNVMSATRESAHASGDMTWNIRFKCGQQQHVYTFDFVSGRGVSILRRVIFKGTY
jgi:hypothetical protein